MALEIERRFLVAGQDWRPLVRWQARLRQGYLASGGDGLTVRVRLSEAEAWLTLKAIPPGGSDALTRLEFEYGIPLADGEALLALTQWQLVKCRYGLELPGGAWVLDVFEGSNAPLVVAEVELAAVDQPLVVPRWCACELSGRHDLSNAALAARPLASWSEAERQALLAGLPEEAEPAG